MAVGFSDGKSYKDESEWLVETHSTAQTGSSTPSTMPLGGSTEPADALFSPGGGGSTGESASTEIRPVPYGLNPPERETPFPRPRMTGIISGLWDSIKKGMSLTEAPAWALDETTGEYHTSPQAIERAADLAGLMTFGPAPVASKMADGTLGSFMGVTSKTIDKTKLYKAQELEFAGTHPDDIWKETGSFRGADGRWRQEIPDTDAKILDKGTINHPAIPDQGWTVLGSPEGISVKPGKAKLPENASLEDILSYFKKPEMDVRLGHVLDHPKLYDAYPWLKNVKIEPMPEGLPYWGMVRGDTLFMNKLSAESFKSTLMHEVQHLIQNREGFASGGNAKNFIPKALETAETDFHRVRMQAEEEIAKKMGDIPDAVGQWKSLIRREQMGGTALRDEHKDLLKEFKNNHPDVYRQLDNIVKSERLLSEAKTEAHGKYERVMGEVEARTVQARLAMEDWQRKFESPRATEERLVPRSKQINPDDVTNHMVGNWSASEVPGQFTPVSPRWPSNDNMRPRNAFERHIEAYDEMVRWRESLPKNEWGMTQWNDLTMQQHKNKLKAIDKILDE